MFEKDLILNETKSCEHILLGLNLTSESWEYQIRHFGSHPDYQVCVFDNRGVGYSDAPPGFYSTSQMAHDIIDLCEHIGWTNNVHLIGVSMGGMIAQELVLAKPLFFKSLCLTSTTPGMSLPPLLAVTTISKLMFIRNPLEKVEITVRLIYPKEWLEAPAPPGSPHPTNEKHMLDKFLERMTSRGIQPVNAACLRHYCSPDRLRRIKHNIPQILVVTGSWDNLIRPENSYYLAEQLNADFEYWEGSGHALPGEQAERYNDLLDVHFRKAGLVDTIN
ncbi:6114_t:CDS:10 [Funneliformis mosseae]|uniref:6114_t:CDS:1 n=1 Tax=Funneliformis mosseae TaxID=27381 RepID=A0A9N9F6K8_FUNMO|nr:6114_t:CDS:10 [Funneliformis mosseae]